MLYNKEELVNLLSEDEHIKSIDLEIVKPGDSVRITPVKRHQSNQELKLKETVGEYSRDSLAKLT